MTFRLQLAGARAEVKNRGHRLRLSRLKFPRFDFPHALQLLIAFIYLSPHTHTRSLSSHRASNRCRPARSPLAPCILCRRSLQDHQFDHSTRRCSPRLITGLFHSCHSAVVSRTCKLTITVVHPLSGNSALNFPMRSKIYIIYSSGSENPTVIRCTVCSDHVISNTCVGVTTIGAP
jgi:hypothetical protein